MKLNALLIATACLGLVACSQTGSSTPAQTQTPPAAAQPSPGRTCDVSLIDSIGAPIASVSVPNNANYRIIRPNDVLTLDARETRTNIDLNADDTIAAVYCG